MTKKGPPPLPPRDPESPVPAYFPIPQLMFVIQPGQIWQRDNKLYHITGFFRPSEKRTWRLLLCEQVGKGQYRCIAPTEENLIEWTLLDFVFARLEWDVPKEGRDLSVSTDARIYENEMNARLVEELCPLRVEFTHPCGQCNACQLARAIRSRRANMT